MAVITISRELGSDGDKIVDFLCESLGYCRVDKAMVTQIAQEAGVSTAVILDVEQSFAKRARPVSEDMLSLYRKQASAFETPRIIDDMTYVHVAKQTIEKFARRGDAIIVGRGGQMVLRGWPNALHIRLHAPLNVRIQRLMKRYDLAEAQARQRIQQSDEKRRQYIRRMHNNADWRNAKYYDLVIDTSRISPDNAAQMIMMAASNIDRQRHVYIQAAHIEQSAEEHRVRLYAPD